MFDLDKEVADWIRAVTQHSCEAGERHTELEDHLYSEIDRLQASGLSPKEAFYKATEQMGKPETLAAEFAKNRSLLGKIYAFEQAQMAKMDRPDWSPRKTTAITLGHSLLFASAMILTPLLISNSEAASFIVMGILLPLWFASFMFVPGIRRSAECEYRALKKLFGQRG